MPLFNLFKSEEKKHIEVGDCVVFAGDWRKTKMVVARIKGDRAVCGYYLSCNYFEDTVPIVGLRKVKE